MEEEKNIENNKKSCFIITPIGSDTSDIRRAADGVIESAIYPVLIENGFDDIKAAHQISSPGSINNQIIQRILRDDLVIANLTGTNPNVMYELAVRHTTKKPIIHICETNTKLPFDIIDQRTIFYKNDMLGVKELKEQLEKMVCEAMSKDIWDDNPIHNADKDYIFKNAIINDPDKQILQYIIQKLDALDKRSLSYSFADKFPKWELLLSIPPIVEPIDVVDYIGEKLKPLNISIYKTIIEKNSNFTCILNIEVKFGLIESLRKSIIETLQDNPFGFRVIGVLCN